MTGWLSLTDEQRRSSLQQAFLKSGIQTKAIEKDWWVTLSLKALFNTPYAKYCIFKGGTSLSKGWKLIQRFSEDIDIALSTEAFGVDYVDEPSHSFVKKIKRLGCHFTNTEIKESLIHSFNNLGIPEGLINIEAEPVPNNLPDKDPQTLFIRYPSLFDRNPYLADEIKMEFGVRSLKHPFANVSIQSILSEAFPNPIYKEESFEIVAVEPRKTLLEKLFLLHEKFSSMEPDSFTGDRQSRHLYDIVSLMETNFANLALEDTIFYNTLLKHRKYYSRISGIDYEMLRPRFLNFVPPDNWLDIFRSDYVQMQQAMIYGESPEFEDLIQQLKMLNERFRVIEGDSH